MIYQSLCCLLFHFIIIIIHAQEVRYIEVAMPTIFYQGEASESEQLSVKQITYLLITYQINYSLN